MSAIIEHSTSVVPGDGKLEILLIEDDPGDAFLFEELLGEELPDARIVQARTLREARERLRPGIHCAVVDLSLPDAEGLDLLRAVLDMAPRSAVLVLTGRSDAAVGVAAVAAGAEDYLIKHEVDGPLLARAIRYALERKRAEDSERQLMEAELRSEENARIELGLLPVPLIDDPELQHHTRYRPGRERALLGGDFYDTVQTADGTVHLVIGDVCGHGPDEASLGVRLRMAWRTLVLAGHTGMDLLGTLDTVLGHERWSEEIFTTLSMVTIAPDRQRARFRMAGHPAPLLFGETTATALPDDAYGPALGLFPGSEWPAAEVELTGRWSLMLYTDGLIEGRVGGGPDRLGTEGLVEMASAARAQGLTGDLLIDHLVTAVEALNGEALTDDLAVVMLSGKAAR
ncbi:PP2C family protein-serine/threonine phosphatase [Actinoallomurus sp. CA-150999]|uniref:PP2C family protein-serine/threonine phosphatase n=1 Tax=Actinoallomurus sp. CA-150999 TaxID=3239887 RepID=UPI003D8FB7C7